MSIPDDPTGNIDVSANRLRTTDSHTLDTDVHRSAYRSHRFARSSTGLATHAEVLSVEATSRFSDHAHLLDEPGLRLRAVQSWPLDHLWHAMMDARRHNRIIRTTSLRDVSTAWNLERAVRRTCRYSKAPGIDGLRALDIRAARVESALLLQRRLRTRTYRPLPFRVVQIPKPDGRMRTLEIPSLHDRIVMRACLDSLGPRVDAHLSPCVYGFRPKRSPAHAVNSLRSLPSRDRRWIVLTDIRDFFPSLLHSQLDDALRPFCPDPHLLELLQAFYSSPELPQLAPSAQNRGVPQGSALSPLLANLFLRDFDHAVAELPCQPFRFADDLLIACPTKRSAEECLNTVSTLLSALGLELSMEKTRVVAYKDGFEYLGFSLSRAGVAIPGSALDELWFRIDAVEIAPTKRKLFRLRRHVCGWVNYYRHTVNQRQVHSVLSQVNRRLAAIRSRIQSSDKAMA